MVENLGESAEMHTRKSVQMNFLTKVNSMMT